MKYFQYKLWMDQNSDNIAMRQAALPLWKEMAVSYQEDYLLAREHLSKAFVKTFEDNFGFHGYFITAILITESCTKPSRTKTQIKGPGTCKIILSDIIHTWQLTYYGLYTVKYLFPSGTDILPGDFHNIEWEFSELRLLNGSRLSHEILLSDGSTLLIHFTRVSAREINNP